MNRIVIAFLFLLSSMSVCAQEKPLLTKDDLMKKDIERYRTLIAKLGIRK